jgi:hypothetical protein
LLREIIFQEKEKGMHAVHPVREGEPTKVL